jgi:hypothetical protein
MSSSLFRLTSAKNIIDKVSFLNTNNDPLGLLVMKIDDTKGVSVDDNIDSIIAVFNTSTKAQHFAYDDAGKYRLHDVQQASIDEVVQLSNTDNKGFTVGALSSVVFVKRLDNKL